MSSVQSKGFSRRAMVFNKLANILEGPYKEIALGLAEVAEELAQVAIQEPEIMVPVEHGPSDNPLLTGDYYGWFRRTHDYGDCLDCGEPVAIENQFRHANAWHHGRGRYTITVKPDKPKNQVLRET